MNGLALISILIGILFIVIRAPLIFAPETTKAFYLKLVASNTRIRIMSLCLAAVGTAAIMAARGSDQTAALIILILGWLWVLAAVFFLLIFPSLYRRIAEAFLQAMDNLILRLLGFFAVLLGAFFIYLGLVVFS